MNTILTDELITREWHMMRRTENAGGRAACQDDREQFSRMRLAQFQTWDAESAARYLEDLKTAEREHINLIAVKYAYMMEHRFPEEYARLAPRLPAVPPEKRVLVERLTAMTVAWGEDFARAFPALAARGRPIHSARDTEDDVSAETYARGELSSYSLATLESLLRHYTRAAEAGRNLYREAVAHEVRFQGFPDLDAAERYISSAERGRDA